MNLTAQQIAEFDAQGYLFLPGCFSEEEIGVLRAEAEKIYQTERQEVWREKTGARRTAFAADGGIVAPTGRPGSVLMFHGNLVHASPPNITPYPRKIVYLTLCAVSNHITKFTRPEWIAHRDFTPIEPVADDALLRYARSYRVAAE